MTTKFIAPEFKIWRWDFADVFLRSRYKDIYNSYPSQEEINKWEAMAKSVFSTEILLDRFQCTLLLIAEEDAKSTYFYSPTELIELTLEKIRNDIKENIELDKETINKYIGYLFNSMQRQDKEYENYAKANDFTIYHDPIVSNDHDKW
jgi:hypothetical protein